MPRIPKWLGDTMETVFSRMITPAIVTKVEYIFPELKRVIMEGDFTKINFMPGNVIEFRVTDTDFRHYTVSALDQEKGVCEMLVYLHERGVGSNWVKNIRPCSKCAARSTCRKPALKNSTSRRALKARKLL